MSSALAPKTSTLAPSPPPGGDSASATEGSSSRSVSRTREGISVLSGGRDHLTHRLLPRLGSARRVALALGIAQAALCALVVVSVRAGASAVLSVAGVLIVAGAIGVAMMDSPAWRPREARTGTPR